ncbi:lipoprotein [uncultured Methylibium sp.]|uniref:LPS translocon maturation chaperone LptM n=1 Tax=uncultured Methylibium sp. TaxID=381093 RepID=UPI0025EF0D0A|nr:lipoprotein [uncultured Methylibium sp.]
MKTLANILGSRITAIALCVSASLLAGCGQKGPLFLPAPASAASVPSPATR